jgi:hypothetical protein
MGRMGKADTRDSSGIVPGGTSLSDIGSKRMIDRVAGAEVRKESWRDEDPFGFALEEGPTGGVGESGEAQSKYCCSLALEGGITGRIGEESGEAESRCRCCRGGGIGES